MSRIRLKCGGKRRNKALLGADGAVMAAATLAAAGINAAATAAAAKSQARAVEASARTQANSIKQQTANNNALQKEQLSFTREQNQENRQQQQDIQATLQLMAGQENMNDRMERNKMQVKFGGSSRHKLESQPFYGGANSPQFQVTDGGEVLPIATDVNGYGLYEIYGNDHEHYHKTKNGKNKTGVGIKFNDGTVVEGEGNQNTNQGELLYITPQDAMFISKHSIKGFNPAEAVMEGVHPEQAFVIQERLKDISGLNDDGTKTTHKSIKRSLGGISSTAIDQANFTQNPINGTAPVSAGIIYALTRPTTPPVEGSNNIIARNGTRIALKCGGKRRKALFGITKKNFEPYAGATIAAGGNIIGAGLNAWGNMYAGRTLSNAYNRAGDILANAYSQMHGIDMSELNREDYEAPHTLAVVRQANTNINPQLERIRRNSEAEKREITRGTLSSAARQQRLAAANDRMFQRMGEQYSYKENADEAIKQANAERITQTAAANADRDVQARRDYGNQRMSLLQYNNNIENAKIAGMAQARADALTQASSANATAFQSTMAGIGNALNASASGFASTYDGLRKSRLDRDNILIGADLQNQVAYLTQNPDAIGNLEKAKQLYNSWSNSENETYKEYARQLKIAYNF